MNKISVIGGGYWGINIIRNLYNLNALDTVVETNKDIYNKILKVAPNINLHDDYDEVLKDKRIGSVVIATPASYHGSMVKKALRAEKNVFVEKPLCLELKEAHEIKKLALSKNLKVMIGHLLLYHPAFVALKKKVEEGAIGKLRYIYSNRLSLGKLRKEEDVLWSFAPHDISMILSLIKDQPEKVEAFGGSYLSDNIKDTTVTIMKFKDNIKAHIFVSWLHPYKDQRLIVIGDKGMIVFADILDSPKKLTLYEHKAVWNNNIPVVEKTSGVPIKYDMKLEPLKVELESFINWIEGGAAPPSDINEGIKVLEVLDNAREKLGRW